MVLLQVKQTLVIFIWSLGLILDINRAVRGGCLLWSKRQANSCGKCNFDTHTHTHRQLFGTVVFLCILALYDTKYKNGVNLSTSLYSHYMIPFLNEFKDNFNTSRNSARLCTSVRRCMRVTGYILCFELIFISPNTGNILIAH